VVVWLLWGCGGGAHRVAERAEEAVQLGTK